MRTCTFQVRNTIIYRPNKQPVASIAYVAFAMTSPWAFKDVHVVMLFKCLDRLSSIFGYQVYDCVQLRNVDVSLQKSFDIADIRRKGLDFKRAHSSISLSRNAIISSADLKRCPVPPFAIISSASFMAAIVSALGTSFE